MTDRGAVSVIQLTDVASHSVQKSGRSGGKPVIKSDSGGFRRAADRAEISAGNHGLRVMGAGDSAARPVKDAESCVRFELFRDLFQTAARNEPGETGLKRFFHNFVS